MVFSASSVYSFQNYHQNSYAVVVKQLTWVAIGLPCAWVAGHLPQRWIRRLAWPGYFVSLGLLLLTSLFGVTRNGNTNWLAVGPLQIQPSEIAKLALVLWAAHVYANKNRRLGNLHELTMPVVPGLLVATGLVIFGHDLGTALVLFAILLGLLWVVGAPARMFALSFLVISVFAGALAAADPERLTRITTFTDPMRDYNSAGWQPAHGLFALSQGGLFGQGIGASQQKWGNLPEAHTDFIFAVLGEELGPGRHPARDRAVPDHRLRRHPGRPPHQGPVRPLHDLRDRGLDHRPDDDQRRHGPGPAPGHRHPAATGLLRRLRAGAVAGRAGHARRVRASRARGRPGARPAEEVPRLGRDRRPRRRATSTGRVARPR